jgi:phosphohistidine swiveling domain-containing protein
VNPAQPHLTGLSLQAALVAADAGIATRGAALIALRIAQPIRLGIEQGVQRLLHGAPHHPVEVALDPLVVNRDDVVQWTR